MLPPIHLALFLSLFSPLSWGEKAAQQPNTFEQFFPFILIGLVFYFLLIRPQQKKHKSHQEFLSQLQRGEEVLTSGGVFGTISGLNDQFVILEVSDDVQLRILKSHILSYVNNKTSKETKS